MKLKITMENVSPYNIYIRDVMECGEHLLENYGVAYGLNVDEYIGSNIFFANLDKGIKNGRIYKLVKDLGVSYKLGYLEECGGVLNSREVELDVLETSIAFKSRLDKMAMVWQKKQKKFSKKTFKLIAEKGNPSDALVKCVNSVCEYSRSGRIILNMSDEEFGEFYDRLDGNRSFLKHGPMKIPKLSNSERNFYIIGTIILIVVFIWGHFALEPIANILYPAMFSAFEIGYFVKDRLSDIDGIKNQIFDHFKRDFHDVYDERVKNLSLARDKSKNKKKNIVDFVKGDLEIVQGKYAEALIELATAYSKEKASEVFEGYAPVSKYKYLMSLIQLESEMYADQGEFRFIKVAHITPSMMDDRLEFLGWSAERIKNDELIGFIRLAMKEISLKPYLGVEVELLKLMKLALQYAGIDAMSEMGSNKMVELIDSIVATAHVKLEMTRLNEMIILAEKNKATAVSLGETNLSNNGRRIAFSPQKRQELQ